MKPAVLLLSLLTLAACAGASEAPACRGEVFQLNPTRMTAAPAAISAGSALR